MVRPLQSRHLTPRHARALPGADGERGSMSAWAAVTAVSMLVFVGLAIDFGGQLQAQQHARFVASQAARSAGQQLTTPTAIRGGGATLAPADAEEAANTYLAAAGLPGAVTVTPTTITVSVTNTYTTKVLNIIGITTLPADGTASARIARVYEGDEQ